MYSLLSKITDQSAKIAIIGQGYVGLPLAMAFAKKFIVSGYDISKSIVEHLLAGKSHIQDVPDEQLSRYLRKTYFRHQIPKISANVISLSSASRLHCPRTKFLI